MLYAVVGIIGLTIGVSAAFIFMKVKNIGYLRIDKSDPMDNPYLFLELRKDIGAIEQKKYVILKVNNQNYISHK